MSNLIVNYANRVFPELNLQLLENKSMSRELMKESKEAEKDPVKVKYLRNVFGCWHTIVYGSKDGLYFAFDSLGIDTLESDYSSGRGKPLTQVFVANNHVKLEEILVERYVSKNWRLVTSQRLLSTF